MDSENISICEGLREKGKIIISIVQFSTKGVIIVFFSLIVLTALIYAQWFNDASFLINNTKSNATDIHQSLPPTSITLSCPTNNTNTRKSNCGNRKAPNNYPISPSPLPLPSRTSSSPSCPEFFRYIYEDLKPWKSSGITKEMVESARIHATVNFRLVIVKGRAYLEKYSKAFQTRDVFTIWGILQLLNRYPGRVPDLDLMFNCFDTPAIKADKFQSPKSPPPPLFRYCKDGTTLDIVFPDWSFWGWAELNIKPWSQFLEETRNASKTLKWKERQPYAFWKGNPYVADTRRDLLKCNPSNGHDSKARIIAQDWDKEIKNGFKQSNLAKQCNYRYKIYIEGRSWSVSEKYILACDSPTLRVTSPFIDFFSRGLIPGQHYWPIRPNRKCKSINYAVNWGNKYQKQAQEIGKGGSLFTREELSMNNVYDYMLHLLTEYAKLMKYKPTIPEKATEICIESMACSATGPVKQFMLDSMEKSVYQFEPCGLPLPFDQNELEEIMRRKEKYLKAVEKREDGSKL
ncbi:hypothetical protein LUZ60_012110 [Juncus effusus]|nr:hypothetical protein LUZ60_012110 [Juncus effusus]